MFYVPVTDTYCRLPITYVPVYSTTIDRTSNENSSSKLNYDVSKVKRELEELREELDDLRLEKESCRLCSPKTRIIRCDDTCRLCSPTTRSIQCDETCSICYPRIREREETYSRSPSPVHYCSICRDYVIDETVSRSSPRPYKTIIKKKDDVNEDKLSEYLSRQLDLERLRPRYIPEERPIWIPTAYKHDYPHRRWATRHANFSEP
jgi:hypothetical protein